MILALVSLICSLVYNSQATVAFGDTVVDLMAMIYIHRAFSAATLYSQVKNTIWKTVLSHGDLDRLDRRWMHIILSLLHSYHVLLLTTL